MTYWLLQFLNCSSIFGWLIDTCDRTFKIIFMKTEYKDGLSKILQVLKDVHLQNLISRLYHLQNLFCSCHLLTFRLYIHNREQQQNNEFALNGKVVLLGSLYEHIETRSWVWQGQSCKEDEMTVERLITVCKDVCSWRIIRHIEFWAHIWYSIRK